MNNNPKTTPPISDKYYLCDICGRPRVQRGHEKCSKILQSRYFKRGGK